MPSQGEKYYFVASLAKGLRIVELLAAKGPMSASQMAKLLDTSRAAAHRFLTTLRDLDYVEKTDGGKFSLTFKVLELGMKKLDNFEIRHIAHPFMQEISVAFGETVNLGHWDGRGIVHLYKINSREIFRLDVEMGGVAPAYCTGLGKAILAFLPEREREEYLATTTLDAISPKTITSPDKLREELIKIRKKGFAIDNEELSIGLRCVATPIFDYTGRPSYALSVTGPTQRMTDDKLHAVQAKLLQLCPAISRKIGAPE